MKFIEPEQVLQSLNLSEGLRIADLGAGSGFYSFAASAQVGSMGKVYAVDVQKELVSKVAEEARSRGLSNIEVIWGDIEKEGGIKIPDNQIDLVILANVLFQTKDKEGVLKEAKRILKDSGRVLVVDWLDSFGGLGPQPEHVFSQRNAKDLFEKVGFDFLNTLEGGAHHYGLIFRNKKKTK